MGSLIVQSLYVFVNNHWMFVVSLSQWLIKFNFDLHLRVKIRSADLKLVVTGWVQT